MQTHAFEKTHSRIARRLATAALALLAAMPALAQHAHAHTSAPATQVRPTFVASTAKPFTELMDDAMAVMDHGMRAAPMNGDPDHDFAAMMIPHHQGAVDMAKAVLLYGKNPVLRRLAQEIIVTQGSEISVMQSELNKMSPASQPSHASRSSTHKDQP